MSNLTTTSTRRAPWIGIGVSGMWTDYREALRAAELDFKVLPYDAKVELVQDEELGIVDYERVPDVQVNIRDTDNKILGCVSDHYSIVQNEDAFSLLEPFLAAGGYITNAGMTEQGLVFMVAHIRKKMILGDEWDFDIMCTNSFNGSFPLALIMTPTRIICQNMYRKLMDNDALLHVRHSSLANSKLAAAKLAASGLLGYITAFNYAIEYANTKTLSAYGMETIYIPMLFPYPKGGGKQEATSRAKVDARREEFMDVYYNAADNKKYHGKVLGFINAYYDYLSHRNPTKNMPGSWNDRRLSGLISGNDINKKLIKGIMS